MPKLMRLRQPEAEDLFIERYDRLLAVALQYSRGDRQEAEDLVQDAFVAVAVGRIDLAAVRNMEAYLLGILRYLHISRLRRALQRRTTSLGALDFDSAELTLRGADAMEMTRVREELLQICRRACERKETSKAASVLILRFFHGYYPVEIAAILRSTTQRIDHWLWLARKEARLALQQAAPSPHEYPANPADARSGKEPEAAQNHAVPRFLKELQSLIFRSGTTACPPVRELEGFYRSPGDDTLPTGILAHGVSCRDCLQRIEAVLGLNSLDDRFPTDTLGPGLGGRPPSGKPRQRERRALLRRRLHDRLVKAVLEHRPRELHVLVNGFLQAVHTLNARRGELVLTVNPNEPIAFIEVFSEQNVRLLLLPVEPLPAGALEQSMEVSLSGRRRLSLTLNLIDAKPSLRLSYDDPGWQPQPGPFPVSQPQIADWPRRAREILRNKGRRWLTPSRLMPAIFSLATATGSLLLALWLAHGAHRAAPRGQEPPPAPPTAGILLERAALAAGRAASPREIATHRTLRLGEQRGFGLAEVTRRIEVWESAAQGITARRLYDDEGRLLAGEWANSDGTRMLYRHGRAPRPAFALSAAVEKQLKQAWRHDPSVQDFRRLVGDPTGAVVKQTQANYSLQYTARKGGPGLVRASLTLARNGLRATDESFAVRLQNGEEQEFRIVETRFEEKPMASVSPAIFSPEPELLALPRVEDPAPPTVIAPAPAATVDLEIRILSRLHSVDADLGEEATLMRNSQGILQLEAIEPTAERKRQILAALGPLAEDPTLNLHVVTVGEALAEQSPQGAMAEETVSAKLSAQAALPVEDQVRAYLQSQGMDPQRQGADVAREIDRIANAALGHSRAVLFHSLAMSALAARFSPQQLAGASLESRAALAAMLREHAAVVQRETGALILELRPIFGLSTGRSAAIDTIARGRTASIEALLQIARFDDGLLHAAFTLSDPPGSPPALDTRQFWRNLSLVEQLAAELRQTEP